MAKLGRTGVPAYIEPEPFPKKAPPFLLEALFMIDKMTGSISWLMSFLQVS
jgi:hypothetical protein